jgi:chromosome segregation ATPase
MNFAEEIKERKERMYDANALALSTAYGLVDALELRIEELGSDLDNAHEDIEREKALTKKLKGKLDGMVELVGELVVVGSATKDFIGVRCGNTDAVANAVVEAAEDVLTKAKESMP